MDSENEVVTKEIRLKNLEDMMTANAEIMEEIANDSKLTAVEKMRGFGLGVRNQVALSRDQQTRITMLAKLGMKATKEIQSLTFDPTTK